MKTTVGNDMTLDSFQNERAGNHVEWRIVRNVWQQSQRELGPLFVYRRVETPNGRLTSQYLTTAGRVDNNCGNGWFRDMGEVGAALVRHAALVGHGGGAEYDPSYLAWIDGYAGQPV